MSKRCVLWRDMGKGKRKKYYGVLDTKGKIIAVQEYKICHQRDLRTRSKAERNKNK